MARREEGSQDDDTVATVGKDAGEQRTPSRHQGKKEGAGGTKVHMWDTKQWFLDPPKTSVWMIDEEDRNGEEERDEGPRRRVRESASPGTVVVREGHWRELRIGQASSIPKGISA